MKNLFKKISAILMAAIMVLAMASTAFAADAATTTTGSITVCGEYAQTSGEGTQSSDEGCEGGSENREEGYRNHQSDASDACSLCCDRNCDRGDPGCRYQFCSEQKTTQEMIYG